MIKLNNYYNVQYYMVKLLKLKGLELQIYAIIKGFSQADGNYYTAPLGYLMEFTGASKPAVITAIKKLIDKELIIKEENIINNVNMPKYKINDLKNVKWLNLTSGKETLLGGKETLLGGKETLPGELLLNNNYNNKIIINDNIEQQEQDLINLLNEL